MAYKNGLYMGVANYLLIWVILQEEGFDGNQQKNLATLTALKINSKFAPEKETIGTISKRKPACLPVPSFLRDGKLLVFREGRSQRLKSC